MRLVRETSQVQPMRTMTNKERNNRLTSAVVLSCEYNTMAREYRWVYRRGCNDNS
jgi:hypothetical protein